MIASVATATRYDSVACDDGRFISLKERALALLTLVLQRSAACSHQRQQTQRRITVLCLMSYLRLTINV